MIEMSEYIKKNTDKEAIFLTSTTHINPVVSLAGRNIYVGSSLYVYYHGLGDDFSKRNMEVAHIYNSDYQTLVSFCRERGIKYIYVGSYEKGAYNINWDTISSLEEVVSFGDEALYEI